MAADIEAAEQEARRAMQGEAHSAILGLAQRVQRPWPWVLPILLAAVSEELGRRLGAEAAAELLLQEAARHAAGGGA